MVRLAGKHGVSAPVLSALVALLQPQARPPAAAAAAAAYSTRLMRGFCRSLCACACMCPLVLAVPAMSRSAHGRRQSCMFSLFHSSAAACLVARARCCSAGGASPTKEFGALRGPAGGAERHLSSSSRCMRRHVLLLNGCVVRVDARDC